MNFQAICHSNEVTDPPRHQGLPAGCCSCRFFPTEPSKEFHESCANP